MRRARGHSLIEIMVSVSILSMLFVMMFWIYKIGAGAWMKQDTESELIQQAQTISAKLTRETERSAFSSLSLDPVNQGLAFLSAIDVNNRFVYNPATGQPVWQKYVIVYRDPATSEVLWGEVPVGAAQQATDPGPISTFPPYSPLSSYFTRGAPTNAKPIAHNIAAFNLSVTNQVLVANIDAQKKRYGSEGPERHLFTIGSGFRN